MYISVVTLAEARFGVELLKKRSAQSGAKVKPQDLASVEQRVQSMSRLATILHVTPHVAEDHGMLRAAWAQLRVPKLLASGKLKNKPVEQWHEDVPTNVLHISENDLWIAATAITHDLTLVTFDGDHERLRDASPLLKVLLL